MLGVFSFALLLTHTFDYGFDAFYNSDDALLPVWYNVTWSVCFFLQAIIYVFLGTVIVLITGGSGLGARYIRRCYWVGVFVGVCVSPVLVIDMVAEKDPDITPHIRGRDLSPWFDLVWMCTLLPIVSLVADCRHLSDVGSSASRCGDLHRIICRRRRFAWFALLAYFAARCIAGWIAIPLTVGATEQQSGLDALLRFWLILHHLMFVPVVFLAVVADSSHWRVLFQQLLMQGQLGEAATRVGLDDLGGVGGSGGGGAREVDALDDAMLALFHPTVAERLSSARARELRAIDLSEIKFLGKLGAGGQSSVYRGVFRREFVAVKKSILAEVTTESVEALIEEACVLHRLKHPNIVNLIGMSISPPDIMVIMPALETNLGSVISKWAEAGSRPSHGMVFSIASQIGVALEYLHRKDMAHRDLKPQNVLLTGPCPAGRQAQQLRARMPHVKLCDFGLAVDDEMAELCERGGTFPYLSPEAMPVKSQPHSYIPSDVWAYGCLLFEMMSLQPPWKGCSMSFQFIEACFASDTAVPGDASKLQHGGFEEIVRNCWSRDMDSRSSMLTIVKTLREGREFADLREVVRGCEDAEARKAVRKSKSVIGGASKLSGEEGLDSFSVRSKLGSISGQDHLLAIPINLSREKARSAE